MTYPASLVGRTLDAERDVEDGEPLLSGFRRLRVSSQLGVGGALFESAVDAVMGWELHRRAGIFVEATQPRVVEGAEVTVGVGWGPFRISAPCMVVATVAQRNRAGFAYGTLAGHPESGEEAFIVERREATAQVWLHIVAFSRPARWWSRAGGPVTHWVQGKVTQRYLRALIDQPRPRP